MCSQSPNADSNCSPGSEAPLSAQSRMHLPSTDVLRSSLGGINSPTGARLVLKDLAP